MTPQRPRFVIGNCGLIADNVLLGNYIPGTPSSFEPNNFYFSCPYASYTETKVCCGKRGDSEECIVVSNLLEQLLSNPKPNPVKQQTPKPHLRIASP